MGIASEAVHLISGVDTAPGTGALICGMGIIPGAGAAICGVDIGP